MRLLVLINPSSGAASTVGAEGIEKIVVGGAATGGHSCVVEAGPVPELVAAATGAQNIDCIVSAGGDGTLAAIAQAVYGKGLPVLPLPCGTINLFCRDVGVPDDLAQAVEIGLASDPTDVDAGWVETEEFGARLFHSNIVFGPYANFAAAREDVRAVKTLDDVSFALVETAVAITETDAQEYLIEIDNETPFAFSTNTLVVSNNPYARTGGLLPRRASLTGGKLAVYLVEADGAAAFAARFLEFVTGRLYESQNIREITTTFCRFRRKTGPSVFSIDGDREEAAGAVAMRIEPRALRMLLPTPPEAESALTEDV